MQMTVDSLVWMTVGIALLSTEAFTGTFHLMFFGISALITALIATLGVNSTIIQLILFAVFSLVSVLVLRQRMVIQSKGFTSDETREFTLQEAIKAKSETTIHYHGAPWTAINVSDEDLKTGDTARVVKTEGIKLHIEPVRK